MSEVPHLLGVSRLWSLSLPLVLSLHVPMCLWENGPPLSVPMADPLPADASLGTSAPGGGCISVTLPVAVCCCPASPFSDTPVSVSFPFVGEGLSKSLLLSLCCFLDLTSLRWFSLAVSVSLGRSLCISLCISDTPSLSCGPSLCVSGPPCLGLGLCSPLPLCS